MKLGKLYRIKGCERAYMVPESPDTGFMFEQNGYFLYLGLISKKYRFLYKEQIVTCDIYTLEKLEEIS